MSATSSSESYAREAMKIVIAQILKTQGFTKIEPQALHTLTDVLIACKYLLLFVFAKKIHSF
jgi:hypothetical protein